MSTGAYLGIGLLLGAALGFLLGWIFALKRPATPAAVAPDQRVENELRQLLAGRETELSEQRRLTGDASSARASAEASLRAAESFVADARRELSQAQTDVVVLRQEVAAIATHRATAEAERDAARQRLDAQKAELDRQFATLQQAQAESLVQLREQFKALSSDALRQTQPQFLELAKQTLATFQETAKGDLAQRQQAIATLVEPLKQTLDTYQQRLQQAEQAQAGTLGEVKKQLELLALQSGSLSNETLQLRRVLSSNQEIGRAHV